MTRDTRRFELRDRTHEAHERLDSAVGAFRTLDDYRRYVSCLAAFRFTMDDALQHVLWPQHWDFRPASVTRLIAEDALDLGLSPAAHEAPRIDIADASALVGALYVLEGSMLGAQVLKQRAAALGLDETFGARHLVAMSNDIAQWRRFLVVLDTEPDFYIERAASSANAVFALALRCFESEFLVFH